jgi:hypothetical protein
MDWSSAVHSRGVAAVIVGFVLLLNPLVVGAFDVGDPDRCRYEASEVSFSANGTYAFSTHPVSLDSDVACFGDSPSRSCVLERAIHTNGGITYDGPSKHFVHDEYRYVHIWEEGFFRPVSEERGNGTVWYGLEAVPREEALGYIATPQRGPTEASEPPSKPAPTRRPTNSPALTNSFGPTTVTTSSIQPWFGNVRGRSDG